MVAAKGKGAAKGKAPAAKKKALKAESKPATKGASLVEIERCTS